MKKRNSLIIASVLLTATIIVACSKSFLDKPPLGTLTPDIVANEKGVQGILIGAYSMLDGNGASEMVTMDLQPPTGGMAV